MENELHEIITLLNNVYTHSTLGDIPTIKKQIMHLVHTKNARIEELEEIIDIHVEEDNENGCLHNFNDGICTTCGAVE